MDVTLIRSIFHIISFLVFILIQIIFYISIYNTTIELSNIVIISIIIFYNFYPSTLRNPITISTPRSIFLYNLVYHERERERRRILNPGRDRREERNRQGGTDTDGHHRLKSPSWPSGWFGVDGTHRDRPTFLHLIPYLRG